MLPAKETPPPKKRSRRSRDRRSGERSRWNERDGDISEASRRRSPGRAPPRGGDRRSGEEAAEADRLAHPLEGEGDGGPPERDLQVARALPATLEGGVHDAAETLG